MSNTIREPGWYWIKQKRFKPWEVAQYIIYADGTRYWRIDGIPLFNEDVLDAINESKLEPPID